MHQEQLPMYPSGVVEVAGHITFQKENNVITYFNYSMPIFHHAADDIRTFRLITSELYVQGHVKQADIARAFGVTTVSVKRAVKILQTRGPKGFYESRGTRGASVLTAPVLKSVQEDLDNGVSVATISEDYGIKKNTLQKAILEGRLHQAKKKTSDIQD